MQIFSPSRTKYFSTKWESHRGFTLIELLVSMGIIAIITGIVLIKYTGFDSSVLLKNQAYEIALLLRESQVKSVGVTQGEGSFDYPYGASFTDEATAYQSFIFEDATLYPKSDIAAANVLQSFAMGKSMKISEICITLDTDVEICGIDRLDVSFRRPEFKAIFFAENGATDYSTNVKSAKIHISSTSGGATVLIVEVSALGQIVVYDPANYTSA